MFNFLCKMVCGSSGSDLKSEQIKALLQAQGIGVLSSSCCAPTSAANDEAIISNTMAVMRECGRSQDIPVISITDAQKVLGRIEKTLEPAEQRLVAEIRSLFTTHGFNIFPILVFDRKIIFYGGLPTVEMIRAKITGAKEALL